MVDYLNDANVFKDKITAENGLSVENGFTVGPGGLGVGDNTVSWQSQIRVQVANATVRDALVAWRTANDPITPTNPLLVWRADGSLTGVNELTTNGTDWFSESAVSGDVKMTLATTAAYGWLLLQGQTLVSAATNYPALWAAASPVFRSGNNLILPDMRGRAPIGAGQGAGLSLRNLGNQTGAENVALSVGQMPSHAHSGTTNDSYVNAEISYLDSSSNPTSGANLDRASSTEGGDRRINGSAHGHSFTTNGTGGGAAHANVQPSLALNFKVKV